jgi:hypothetical protein
MERLDERLTSKVKRKRLMQFMAESVTNAHRAVAVGMNRPRAQGNSGGYCTHRAYPLWSREYRGFVKPWPAAN